MVLTVTITRYDVYRDGEINYATAITVAYRFGTMQMAKIFAEVSQNILGLKSIEIKDEK